LASNSIPGIDLHIHSTASDGTLTPAEILALAEKLHLSAIAITDHDTIEGSRAALDIGIPDGLEFLTGVEISANPPPTCPCSGSLHILGYGIDLKHVAFNAALSKLQEARKNRTPRIISILNELGIALTAKDIRLKPGQNQHGRPHIAEAMVKKGIVSSINEAFDKYLGTGRPAYVDKYRLASHEAISLILAAGGIPVLAHPVLIKFKGDASLEGLIGTLKAMGLKGLEVFYSEHSAILRAAYTACAKRHGLLITGGTDFHGSLKPDIQLGCGRGDLHIPYEVYSQLTHLR
jgi:hypothetical protein